LRPRGDPGGGGKNPYSSRPLCPGDLALGELALELALELGLEKPLVLSRFALPLAYSYGTFSSEYAGGASLSFLSRLLLLLLDLVTSEDANLKIPFGGGGG
jgi:hypothetical protein